ncbi:MAG TPA: ABC transporter ATP-binding protein [Pirellulales bacterium]|nr:ABC transporter ATP-binding protein [Pirellulales bacterium]
MIAASTSGGQRANRSSPAASNAALVRRMLALGWRYRAGCIRVLAQQTVLVLLSLGGLGLIGLGIDYLRHQVEAGSSAPNWPLGLTPPRDWSPLATTTLVAACIVAVALVQNWLRYRAAVSVADLTQKIVVQLRSDVYDKLQRLSFRFFDQHESGSIINRVTGDVQAVRTFIDGVIIQVVTVLVSLAAYLVYMLSVHVPLSLACLATTPLLWFISVRFARLMRPAYQTNRELADRMVLTLSENVQGVQVVKGFAAQEQEIAKFEAANSRIRQSKHGIFWRISLFQPFSGFLTQLNMLVLLAYGGYLVVQGQLLLGEGLFVFANLMQQFANQVGQLVNVSNSISASLTGAQRVFEVLDAPLEITSRPLAVRLSRAKGAIRFEGLSFAYCPGQEVLSGIDLEILPGECVALVGATGSGKSTLLSLIPRFYDPTSGRLLVDGIDVRELNLEDLRRSIGLVFQENFLFSNTVSANIAFGHPAASQAQVEHAAIAAAADGFVRQMPGGYEAVIGEHGSNLSGGQRQRLAIARALLLEPSILLLDDATTAIDPETEHEILAALERAMRGRTTLLVANRLSTLRRADRIVVLERGRIVQTGTHDELLLRPGPYRRMAELQMHSAVEQPRREAA